MVNFNRKLVDNVYFPWSDRYLDYKRLKKILKQYKQLQPPIENIGNSTVAESPGERIRLLPKDGSTIEKNINGHDDIRRNSDLTNNAKKLPECEKIQANFTRILDEQLQKVESWYKKQANEFRQQLDLLLDQYRVDVDFTEEASLHDSFVELYRLLTLLQNFAILNYTGCLKILKKHDKVFPDAYAMKKMYVDDALASLEFPTNKKCAVTMHILEKFFADTWCERNIQVARTSLLVKQEEPINWGPIYVGIRMGSCLVLAIWVAWDSVISPALKGERLKHTTSLVLTLGFPVYRGMGCLVLLMWLWGSSLYVWRSARINYRYIFELDPRSTKDYNEIFSEATNVTILYLVNVLFYYKVVNGGFPEIIPRGYFPLSIFLYGIYRLIFPWKYRRGLVLSVVQVMMAPFAEVTFLHTFVGDYLTSTVKVIQDITWSVCFFTSGEFLYVEHEKVPIGYMKCSDRYWYTNIVVPFICALPLWWRFQQNLRRIRDTQTWFPHVANAFKYSLAQVVSLFGIFHPLYVDHKESLVSFQAWWVAIFACSSFYTWVWDVRMDWGLGDPKHNFLSNRMMYSSKIMYYGAIVADFFLRFLWMMTLIPPKTLASFSTYLQMYIAPFTMVAELFRRTMWSYFRLENEHLRNTQGFRRVDFIPLHFDHKKEKEATDSSRLDGEQRYFRFTLAVFAVTLIVIGLSFAAILYSSEEQNMDSSL